MNKEQVKQISELKPKISTTPIRIKKSTARSLKALSRKINQKPLGRKVIIDDIIQKSLELLTDKDLEQIKASTYSNADKLELKYKEHCKKNGFVSKEDFFKLLLEGLPYAEKTS